jgi:hypothetical protein
VLELLNEELRSAYFEALRLVTHTVFVHYRHCPNLSPADLPCG